MTAKYSALCLLLFSACCSGCIIERDNDFVHCKSIEELYQVSDYKEFKYVVITNKGDGNSSIIKNDAFNGMNLEVLTIIGNVSQIEPHALRGIKHPTFKFTVIDSTLEELPETLINGLPLLGFEVTLTHVKELKRNFFKDIPLVNRTYIKRNKITTIGSDVFCGTNISTLDLSRNIIATIEDGAFACMKKLAELYLSGNRLTTFDAAKVLGDSSSIKILNLDKNLLTTVSPLPTLSNLRTLSFERNAISRIESRSFIKLPELEELHLPFNKLKSIPNDTLPEHLTKLAIGENPWTCSYLAELKQWAKHFNVQLMCVHFGKLCTISCVE
ncbi:uncharacterized protein CBL_03308 [Carabus blaptoides fortunei]